MNTIVKELPEFKTTDELVKAVIAFGGAMRVKLTQELALDIELNALGGQRDVSKVMVNHLSSIIVADLWQPDTAISFAVNKEGRVRLLNGQHRVLATIKADRAVEVVVTAFEAEDLNAEYAKFDLAGRPRSSSDVAVGFGVSTNLSQKKLAALSAAINLIICNWQSSRIDGVRKVAVAKSIPEWSELLNELDELYPCAQTDSGAGGNKSWQRATILSVMLVTHRYCKEIARKFWTEAIVDDAVVATSPAKYANRLINKIHFSPYQSKKLKVEKFVELRLMAQYWNKYYSGASMVQALRLSDVSRWPGILGTPYAK